MEIKIRQLMEYDKPLVMELIATHDLRPEGILERGTKYWGAFKNDKLVGVIGCEYQNCYGLLRSALVDKQYRNMGIARLLTDILWQTAREENLEAIYLFSTGAGAYWTKLGFKEVAVEEAVKNLSDTPQVKLFETLGWLPAEVAYKIELVHV